MSRMVIDDEMWARLEPLLPKPKGRPGKDDRLFIEGVCWVLRTGAPWRDLPPDYGPWKTVYNRYNNWSKKGELLSNLVYGLGRAPVRLFHYLFTILELNIVDHKGQQIKTPNPLPALLRCF